MPVKSDLYLDTVQVPLVNHPIYSNSNQYKEFHNKSVQGSALLRETQVDWFQENAKLQVTDAQKSKYHKLADRIEGCGKDWIHLKDDHGHEKYTRIHCNNEFCPTCGKKDSQLHKKRMSRAGDRLLWAPLLGYMVFTLPRSVSEAFPDKETLNKSAKAAWEITREHFNTEGGMSRVHLMGERLGGMHIHFNVLFPILQTTGAVPQETLDKVREAWTEHVNATYGLNLQQTDVYYKFREEMGKKLHAIKYVLRPIVTAERFICLPEAQKHKIVELKGWHNTRWFGKLANSCYKKYLKELGVVFDDKPPRTCPICGEKFKFVSIVAHWDIPKKSFWVVDKDTYEDYGLHLARRTEDPLIS